VLAVSGTVLHAVDVRGAAPKPAGSLQLGAGYNHALLVRGTRALAVWQKDPGGGVLSPDTPVAQAASMLPSYHRSVTVLAEIDLGDPTAMKVVRTLEVDGQLVSSRMTGGTARVVITSTPKAMVPAAGDRTLGSRRLAGWVPQARFASKVTGRRHRRSVVGCRAVRRPTAFSGLGMLTVLTIDVDRGLVAVDNDAVMTGAETVYASPTGLYVATQRWSEQLQAPAADAPAPALGTTIHKFDTADAARTTYRGSGEVRGYLLNQWSLSEHEGVLRVASTEAPAWWDGTLQADSESFVTTLAEDGGRLVQRGRVGGLGKGERIYAVRFVGDTGYVVTFRQTDPLYTLDLSDPARPRVLGELKVDGYSSYLHPAGDGLLIGVGQEATGRGQVLGTQVSLFDVSDLARPRRLQQHSIGRYATSEVEQDHHAFLHVPERDLVVIPVAQYALEAAGPQFVGAVAFRVTRAGVTEVGRLEHPATSEYGTPIRRILVVDGRLYAVSEAGLSSADIDTLAPGSWVPFS
jgi:hypothetical protein